MLWFSVICPLCHPVTYDLNKLSICISNCQQLFPKLLNYSFLAQYPGYLSALASCTDSHSVSPCLCYRLTLCLTVPLLQTHTLSHRASVTDSHSVSPCLCYRLTLCLTVPLLQTHTLSHRASVTDSHSVSPCLCYRLTLCLTLPLLQTHTLSHRASVTDSHSVSPCLCYRLTLCLTVPLLQTHTLSHRASVTDSHSVSPCLCYRLTLCLTVPLLQTHTLSHPASVTVVVVVKALFLDGNHVTWYIVIFNGPSYYCGCGCDYSDSVSPCLCYRLTHCIILPLLQTQTPGTGEMG